MEVYHPWLAETDHFVKNPEKVLVSLQEAGLHFSQMLKCSCQVADAICLQPDLSLPGRLLVGETFPNSFKYNKHSFTMSSETGESMNSQYFSKSKALIFNLFASYRLAECDLHRLMYPSILSCTA